MEAWDIIGADVVNAINSFNSKKLLKEVNATIITLVPKVQNRTLVKDFWPISCCNTLYKCISKLLANRIKKCLSCII